MAKRKVQKQPGIFHKVGLVIKELRESRVNFKIIKESEIFKDGSGLEMILKENDELIAILYSTLKTAKTRLGLNG